MVFCTASFEHVEIFFLKASLAFAVTRMMAGLLFGITPKDPLTFVQVAIVLIVVAIAASFIPALRATRVDPMLALRHD